MLYGQTLVLCSNPLSRGTMVHTMSTDPTEVASIKLNCLSHPADVEILSRIVNSTLKLYQTRTLDRIGRFSSRSEICARRRYLQSSLTITYGIQWRPYPICHLEGSASMLPLSECGVLEGLTQGLRHFQAPSCKLSLSLLEAYS